jgi:Flp pilus assembly protein TadG
MRGGAWLSRGKRPWKERGSAMIEATLVLVFLFALIFLLIDLSWAVFAKATLQNAVRAGARYAVTSQTSINPGTGLALGQVASIQQVVQEQAMGFLSDTSTISVTFYAVGTNPPTQLTGVGSNAGGNLVMVSVVGYTLSPLAPLLRSATPVTITVSAGDLIEATPLTGLPPL